MARRQFNKNKIAYYRRIYSATYQNNRYSQSVLARELQVTRQMVGLWELNKVQPAPWRHTQIARCLNVPIEKLFPDYYKDLKNE